MGGKNRTSRLPKIKSQDNANKSSSTNKGAASFQSAWSNGNNAAGTLFPDAEVARSLDDELDENMKKAIQASLISHQAKFETVMDQADKKEEEIEERIVDEDYWSSNVHKNLPSPELLKNSSDTNNNSAVKKTNDTKITEHPSSFPTTPRASTILGKNSMKFETATESSNEPLQISPVRLPLVDKHGRIGGHNEQRMFMGRGARKREQMFLEEQQKREALSRSQTSHSGRKTENEWSSVKNSSNSTNSSQKTTSVKNASEKAVKTGGAISRSRHKSVERETSNNEEKSENFERISIQKNSKASATLPQPNSRYRAELHEPRIEKSRFDKTPAFEPPKSETIAQPPVDSAKKSEKVLHINDFLSRHNTPVIEEDDLPSTSQPEVDKYIAETRKDFSKKDCDGTNANVPQKLEISEYTKTPYNSPSKFQSPNQSVDTEDALLSPEVLYQRLLTFDPSLYRLLLEQQMRDIRLSFPSQPAVCTGRETPGNVVDYEDCSGVVDNRDGTMETFAAPRERATGYQETLPRNYERAMKPPRHRTTSEFPTNHPGAFPGHFRPDDSACYFPNSYDPRFLENTPAIAIAYVTPTQIPPWYYNIIQEPHNMIFRPLQGHVAQNSMSHQQRYSEYRGLPDNQGNIHPMSNLQHNPRFSGQYSHDFDPLYDAGIQHPANIPDRNNQGRMNAPRSSFDPGSLSHFSERQFARYQQNAQITKEPRGRGRLQPDHY